MKIHQMLIDDKDDMNAEEGAYDDNDDNYDLKVEEALALGADPNMRGHDGSTALMQVATPS